MNALIVIDPQIDFCPGGALAVQGGDSIMPEINQRLDKFETAIVTQDWHPSGHSSFASSYPGQSAFGVVEMPYGDQVLWPDHCIAGTKGAEFHPELLINKVDAIIRKGSNPQIDSYSAFFENDRRTPTGLAGLLRERGCKALTMVGLATDFCVAWSAIDGANLGFAVEVDLEACRAIDLDGSLDKALSDMRAAGVTILS